MIDCHIPFLCYKLAELICIAFVMLPIMETYGSIRKYRFQFRPGIRKPM
uniref:Uncharacterized protein n=1 Tax=uncultured Desulfobacterium sp. TaxID=201089 RepID=E1YD03_9BACT|nr:unknown protein [uncultured Desulfobacterium sp.]